jgi:hypothetical protein
MGSASLVQKFAVHSIYRMQPNSVIQSARGRWLAGAAVIAGAMLVSACGSSHPTPITTTSASASATPTSSAVAAAPSTSATTAVAPAPATAPASPAATPTAPVNPGGTNAGTTTTCAKMAAHNTYLYVTEAQPSTNGALTLTASPAKLICGGPDDSHYDVAKNVETAHVLAGASIEVFPTTTGQMRDVPIKASQLNSYLKTDHDTKIFLVGGSLSSISSLQEQYHP